MSIYVPNRKLAEQIVANFGSPVFVTDKETIINRLHLLKESFGKNSKIFYAMKANYSPAILKLLLEAGVDGVDCVSPFEIKLAKSVGFKNSQIIFTGNNSDSDELRIVFEEGALLNIGSISELDRYGQMFANSQISLRFNPEIGDGEHDKVITGGKKSKFGILLSELSLAKELIEKYKLNLVGIHCHIGSGFYTTTNFQHAIYSIIDLAMQFKNLEFLDIGGGFGVRYATNQEAINLKSFYHAIAERLEALSQNNGKDIELRLEPGKFLVAESTCLLTKVTTIKIVHDTKFIGTDTGFNHIIRPSFYSAYHQIINLSETRAATEVVTVVGNICESADVLGHNITLPPTKEGDILAILTAGAYCASMSSVYNLRPYATEVIVDKNHLYIARKRLSFEETINCLGFTKNS
ncbi:MAG: diaminopimelate decarboxylase [Rickettsiales bacterium]|nr:diaminopimelate decarboxylase [Rickettsiales bacterium]